jgi:hypothetical protein
LLDSQTDFNESSFTTRIVFNLSAEVERLFLSAKLIILPYRSSLKPELIEASGYIRSWVISRLLFTS